MAGVPFTLTIRSPSEIAIFAAGVPAMTDTTLKNPCSGLSNTNPLLRKCEHPLPVKWFQHEAVTAHIEEQRRALQHAQTKSSARTGTL